MMTTMNALMTAWKLKRKKTPKNCLRASYRYPRSSLSNSIGFARNLLRTLISSSSMSITYCLNKGAIKTSGAQAWWQLVRPVKMIYISTLRTRRQEMLHRSFLRGITTIWESYVSKTVNASQGHTLFCKYSSRRLCRLWRVLRRNSGF